MKIPLFPKFFLILALLFTGCISVKAQSEGAIIRENQFEKNKTQLNTLSRNLAAMNDYNYNIKIKLGKIKSLAQQTASTFDSLNVKLAKITPTTEVLPIKKDWAIYTSMVNYAAKSSSLDSVEKILDFVNYDIAHKYLETNALDTLLEVNVKVFEDSTNEELSGYNVFAKPSMSIDKLDVTTFNPTTNAIKKIRPGKKNFWIERNGTIIKEIQNWGVCIYDKHSQLIIFYVKK